MGRSRWTWMTCLGLCCAPRAAADQAWRETVRRGNDAYAAGKFQEALDLYSGVSADDLPLTTRAELLHNKAAASFKLGQTDQARELWVQAAGMGDAKFEAAARYNLGDCDHAAALEALQAQDATRALSLLDKALAQYADAIRLDPQLESARANLELAVQLKKKLQEQSTSQPQSQPSSQPDKNKDNQKNSQSQPSDNDQNQKDQPQSQPSSQPQSQPSSKPSSQPDPSQDQSDDQQQQENQQDQKEPNEAQSQPASQPKSQPQPAQSQPLDEQQMPNVDMTPQEAQRLLQKVRDAEKTRRAYLRKREAAKYKPVDRDW